MQIASAQPAIRANSRFVDLLNAYRGSGGLARGGEVLSLFGRRGAPDLALLARRILRKQVIALDWQHETWLPWFQFNASGLDVHPALDDVLMALRPVRGPWELANWFVQRHPLLGHRLPVDVFEADPVAVMHAARGDRSAGELSRRESPGHA